MILLLPCRAAWNHRSLLQATCPLFQLLHKGKSLHLTPLSSHSGGNISFHLALETSVRLQMLWRQQSCCFSRSGHHMIYIPLNFLLKWASPASKKDSLVINIPRWFSRRKPFLSNLSCTSVNEVLAIYLSKLSFV